MGFLGNDSDRASEADKIAQEQLDQNKAELEAKKESLYQTRIGIIKGQGGESWTPDYSQKAPIVPTLQNGGIKIPKFGKWNLGKQ